MTPIPCCHFAIVLIMNDQIFCCDELYGSKIFILSYFVRRCHRKHHLFTPFYQFENSLYFTKHDPEVKSFIQIITFIINKKRLTSRVAVNFVDQTRYCTFDISVGVGAFVIGLSQISSFLSSINHLSTPF